jgi:hypothetical protein
MISRISGLASIIFTLFLCPFSTAQVSFDSTYFPLAIGNQWVYQSKHFNTLYTETIVDTVSVNGVLYFGIAAYSKPLVYWVRYENNMVYMAPSISNASQVIEDTVYNFSAQLNSEWRVNLPFSFSFLGCEFNGYTILTDTISTVSTPSGVYSGCARFYHAPDCDDAGRVREWFARGVGRVKYLEDNIGGYDTLYLVEAKILAAVSNANRSINQITYHIWQNYPNPFNPSTTIDFQLPERSFVHIDIFDELGHQIKTLINSTLEEGNQRVIWNATGSPSGIYFCRIQTKSFSQTIRLILLR